MQPFGSNADQVSRVATARVHPEGTGTFRVVLRFLQIVVVLLRHSLAAGGQAVLMLASRRRRQRGFPGPTRLRLLLEGLGVSYMKLGQLLSARADLVPEPYRLELARLRDDAPVMALPVVLREIESSSGRPVAALFRSFSSEPVAAASISQVHVATLPDGRRVAVKVRRPRINARIQADMALLGMTARMAERLSRTARLSDVTGVVAEVAAMLEEETDFVAEAQHAATIRDLFTADATVWVPEVFFSCSGPSMIVMEFVDGLTLGDHAALEAAGLSRSHLAASVIRANVAMLLGPTLFHADLHPGNLMALPDGRLALLDFGATGSTDTETTKMAMTTVFEALMSGDPDGLTEGVLGLTTPTRPVDRPRLSGELDRSLLQPLSDALGTINVGQLLRDLVGILRAHGLRVKSEMTVLVRAVLTCESTARELDPQISFRKVVVPFLVARAFNLPAPVAGLPQVAEEDRAAVEASPDTASPPPSPTAGPNGAAPTAPCAGQTASPR